MKSMVQGITKLVVAICDDDHEACRRLKHDIEIFAVRNSMNADVRAFLCGDDFFADMDAHTPDVVFLDIFIDDESGVDIAKRLRARGYAGQIVFVTGSMDYALDGFAVSAVGYLIKPYTYDDLAKVLRETAQRMRPCLKYISVVSERVERRVHLKDIVYVETQDRMSVICTPGERIVCRIPLRDIEAVLCAEPNFMRCHRCCIINMNHITSPAQDYIVMDTGDRVVISIKDSRKIRQQIADYMFSYLENM